MRLYWFGLLAVVLASCSAFNVQEPPASPTEEPPPLSPSDTPVPPDHNEVREVTHTPTSTQPPTIRAELPDLGAAPELENQVWLNTATPLRLAELRGKVVLLDMWTFG